MAGSAVTLRVRTEPDARLTVVSDRQGEVARRSASSAGTVDVAFRLTDGVHILSIVATDRVGNVSSRQTQRLTIDSTPPSPPQITTIAATATVTQTRVEIAGEVGAGYLMAWVGPSGPIDSAAGTLVDGRAVHARALPDGRYSVQVVLADEGGNTSRLASVPFEVAVPIAPPPAMTVVSSPTSSAVRVAVEGPPDGRAVVRVDGGPEPVWHEVALDYAGRGTGVVTLPDGLYALVAGAVDFQQRPTEGLSPAVLHLVDTNAPTLTVNHDIIDDSGQLVVRYSVMAEEGSEVTVSSDDIATNSFIATGEVQPFTVTLPQGTHRIVVQARDGAGNVRTDGFAVATPDADTSDWPSVAPFLGGLAGVGSLALIAFGLGRRRQSDPGKQRPRT